MTEQELDTLMRRVLLDALRADQAEAETAAAPEFSPSPRYRRQTRTMLADPLAWARRRTRPVWKRALTQAAAVLLAVSLGGGGFLAAVPEARAAVINWAVELYGNTVLYRYSGTPTREELPAFGIIALPAGYTETERECGPVDAFVVYSDGGGIETEIWFQYVSMVQGAAMGFVTEDANVYDIIVNGKKGQFFESTLPDGTNAITWIDENHNIQFSIDGDFNALDMLHMAKSVSLVEMTK